MRNKNVCIKNWPKSIYIKNVQFFNMSYDRISATLSHRQRTQETDLWILWIDIRSSFLKPALVGIRGVNRVSQGKHGWRCIQLEVCDTSTRHSEHALTYRIYREQDEGLTEVLAVVNIVTSEPELWPYGQWLYRHFYSILIMTHLQLSEVMPCVANQIQQSLSFYYLL